METVHQSYHTIYWNPLEYNDGYVMVTTVFNFEIGVIVLDMGIRNVTV
jgi:hypothetical protein